MANSLFAERRVFFRLSGVFSSLMLLAVVGQLLLPVR
jgi:hypothetical protein